MTGQNFVLPQLRDVTGQNFVQPCFASVCLFCRSASSAGAFRVGFPLCPGWRLPLVVLVFPVCLLGPLWGLIVFWVALLVPFAGPLFVLCPSCLFSVFFWFCVCCWPPGLLASVCFALALCFGSLCVFVAGLLLPLLLPSHAGALKVPYGGPCAAWPVYVSLY